MTNKIISALALITAAAAVAETQPAVNTSAIFVSPMTMAITSGMTDMPVITGAFEHRLSESGYSLFIPLHGAFNQSQRENVQYAAGAGLGIRKYIGASFTGSYLTAQTDLLTTKTNDIIYGNGTYDAMGMWIPGKDSYVTKKDFLSISQLAYGYKWGWRQFTLDLSVGGAFYAMKDEKFTNVIGGVNVGFPFNKQTFGL